MIKLIGSLMIVFSSSMIGWNMAASMKKRVELLQNIRDFMEGLAGEILFGREVLPEIIRELSLKTDGVVKEWLCVLYRKMEVIGSCHLTLAWEESLNILKNTELKGEDLEMMRDLGSRISNLNEDRLVKVMEGYVARFDEQIGCLREEYRIKAKMYRSLGILFGFFLIIIVI